MGELADSAAFRAELGRRTPRGQLTIFHELATLVTDLPEHLTALVAGIMSQLLTGDDRRVVRIGTVARREMARSERAKRPAEAAVWQHVLDAAVSEWRRRHGPAS